jgi:putative CocE/NonD family hydrolase
VVKPSGRSRKTIGTALLIGLWVLVCARPIQGSRYIIDDHVLIHTNDGATLSAIVVRREGAAARQPAAFVFTIYAQPPKDIAQMEYAADRGYVGVIAYTRGKLASPQAIVPYEEDGRDANSVIDWIVRQPWSNGAVGMYGGSYNGFTQWAAAKYANPALKTIVPSVAQNPGNGLPMQNNVFLLVNYAWIYYVTDNKLLDDATYDSPQWNTLNQRWYVSGRSYRDVDQVAGRPNPWLQKWLKHPSYDAYWQAMVPYESDFAKIGIPVLTITGYYDDGQLSALGYVRDHYRYNRHADHYVVIGPWDHLGTQRAHKDAILRGYHIDPRAQIDTPKLTFDWLDYVMRGGKKPALLQDRINYEVMGANEWRHAPSLDKMSSTVTTLYLSDVKAGSGYYALSAQAPARSASLNQTVNFADRKTTNNDSYPYLILGKHPDLSNGFAFVSAPLTHTVSVNGSFDGVIRAVVNKKDMDIGVALYQIQPDGKFFQLGYFTERASYAWDLSARRLLRPGVVEVIPLGESTMFSRQLVKGSRLLLTLNVNKNQFAEINYGTGKDVAGEDIADATVPLRIQWLTSSFVRIPISPH